MRIERLKKAPAINDTETHSRFGGMWIDRAGWANDLAARRKAGTVTEQEAEQISRFVADGYLILPRAAPLAAVDRFQAAIAEGFSSGNPDLLYQSHGNQVTRPMDGPVNRLGSRVVDSFVALPQALDLFTAPALIRFLSLIFDADPLLFQSLRVCPEGL
jgi:hypothetical protein